MFLENVRITGGSLVIFCSHLQRPARREALILTGALTRQNLTVGVCLYSGRFSLSCAPFPDLQEDKNR